ALGALRAHRHRDDLVDGELAALALLELHGLFERMRVERVEVLLPAAVQTPRRSIDPLLDGGVRHLFDQDADLHRVNSSYLKKGGLGGPQPSRCQSSEAILAL